MTLDSLQDEAVFIGGPQSTACAISPRYLRPKSKLKSFMSVNPVARSKDCSFSDLVRDVFPDKYFLKLKCFHKAQSFTLISDLGFFGARMRTR